MSDDKLIRETAVPIGDFYKSYNGNIYMALGTFQSIYISNVDISRVPNNPTSLKVSTNPNVSVKILSHEQVKKFLNKG